jgi:hypothetical protein
MRTDVLRRYFDDLLLQNSAQREAKAQRQSQDPEAYSPTSASYSYYGSNNWGNSRSESPVYAPNSPVYAPSSPMYIPSVPDSPPYIPQTSNSPSPTSPRREVQLPTPLPTPAPTPAFPRVSAPPQEWTCDIVSWLAVFNGFFAFAHTTGPPPIVNDTLCIDLCLLPLLPRSFVNKDIVDAVERLMAAAQSELDPTAPVNSMRVEFDSEVGFLVRRPAAGLCIPFKANTTDRGAQLQHVPSEKLKKWDFWKSARVYTRQIKLALSTTELRAIDMPTLTRCAFDETSKHTWPVPCDVASGADKTKPGICPHKLVAMSVDAESFSRAMRGFKERLQKDKAELSRVLLDFTLPLPKPSEFTQTKLILHLTGKLVDVLKPFVPLDMEALEKWELKQIELALSVPLVPLVAGKRKVKRKGHISEALMAARPLKKKAS